LISIVKADLSNPRHGAAVLEVLDAYAADPMGGNHPLSAFTRTHLVDELRKRPAIHVFLAFEGEQGIGLANCIEGFSTFACRPLLNIHDLAVIASHRGRGIARQLIAAVEQHARISGCCKITLEVLEGNAVARKLYAACGFAGYELDPAAGKAMFMQRILD